MAFHDRVTHHPSARPLPRMLRSVWGQTRATPVCPPLSLDGQLALVTGGSRGIGLETSRGLAVRGAEVIAAARGRGDGARRVEGLAAGSGRRAHFLPLDLADLTTFPRTLDRLQGLLGGRRLDILVANAGLWPTRYARSAQGHELAFATNVLGHSALVRGARARGLLAERCRVVIVTGDLYVTARGCSPDLSYRGAFGGFRAYARSKLGNLWYARELARRDPSLCVLAVHPGVVASGLGGGRRGPVGALRRALLLSPEQGAQTSLYCATVPGLVSGGYYHNVLGRVEPSPSDPASDARGAADLWALLERLEVSMDRSRSVQPPA